MNTVTKDEYNTATKNKEEAQLVIDQYHQQIKYNFNKRWELFLEKKRFFIDEELIYSAKKRCVECDAGIAYPENCGILHHWSCSAVLKGETKERHTEYHFAYYSIVSEQQKERAHNQTTRPKIIKEQDND